MAAWEMSTFQESEVVESIAALLLSDLSTSKLTFENARWYVTNLLWVRKERHLWGKNSWLGNVSLVHLTRDDAEDAIDSMDGRTFEGRELRVQLAK